MRTHGSIALRHDQPRLRREFSKKRMVLLQGFLEESFAEELHQALQSLNDRFWYQYHSTARKRALLGQKSAIGHYLMYPLTKHPKNPMSHRELASRPAAKELGTAHPLLRLETMLNSRATQTLIEDLTSIPLSKRSCIAFASRFEPEDFVEFHTDGSFPRRLGFVLYMTKGWKKSWGGNFMGRGSGAPTVVPEFNSLLLFQVPVWHRVSRVSTRATCGRIAIAGWFHDYSCTYFASHAKTTREIPPAIKRMVFMRE